ncbi:Cell division cycle protein 16 -like protein [Halotydeus destructor]|nr:Cell division cycle protein 16 -like protein [Halotydeus destructor]
MSAEMIIDSKTELVRQINPNCLAMNLEYLREKVATLMDRLEYKSASFWADKVVCLSRGEIHDVYVQSQCLYHLKEYHRAIHCIKSRNLHHMDAACRHMVAKCHFTAKEYKEAYEVIVIGEAEGNQSMMEVDPKWKSVIFLLKGQINEALDNRTSAIESFKEALKYDIYCYEAFQALTQHQMLTMQEEEDLLEQLSSDETCAPDSCYLRYMYESLLKKYAKPGELPEANVNNEYLENNVDVLTAQAERCYYNCDYHQCYKITSEVLSRDLYHSQCLPIHLSCLMELKKTNALFELAHKLVDIYPENPISWYAVGCYYLMINKTDAARRYLSKATTLDSVFGPAWLLYGHSFAVESEHDQAMAAYFKASHLMRGCHLPLLYIGLEYGLTDNTRLAEKFFTQALLIAPNDPFVLHELGVIAYQNQEYDTAEVHLLHALEIIKYKKDLKHLPEKWEPLLNNIGHVMRKLKKYEQAIEFHKEALVLSPQNPSSFSALGFVYSLMGKWNEAVEYFHKALGLKRDDPFSTNMLAHAIDHLISGISPVDAIPPYESSSYIEDFLDASHMKSSSLISGENLKPESSNMDIEMDISTE